MKKTLTLAAAGFCFLFLSCSFKAPSVPEIAVKSLRIETDSLATAERLSVFLMYLDEDGKDDYNTVTVIHQDTGLQWQLNRLNSSFFTYEEVNPQKKETKFFVGSNKLAAPHGRIPFGDYTIIAEDLAGNRTVKTVTVAAGTQKSGLPFSFSVSKTENMWHITPKETSFYKNYSLILLGADRQPIFVKKLETKKGEPLEGLLIDLTNRFSDSRYIQCMAENAEGTAAYLTKFYDLY